MDCTGRYHSPPLCGATMWNCLSVSFGAMRLLPQGLSQPSSWTDGGWFEKPGHPSIDGCWIHVPCEGQCLPEFFLVEEHQKIQGEPPMELSIGSGPDCHVRLYEKLFPRRLCRLMKRGKLWCIESLLPTHRIFLQGVPLEVGRLTSVKDGDIIGLLPGAAYRIEINSENYAPDGKGDIYPNRYPARLPFRLALGTSMSLVTTICCEDLWSTLL